MTLALPSFLCLLAQPLSTIVVQQYSWDSQNCETSYLTKTILGLSKTFWISQNYFGNCSKGNVKCNFNNKMIFGNFLIKTYFLEDCFSTYFSKSCKTVLLFDIFCGIAKTHWLQFKFFNRKTVWNSFKILDNL